MRNKIAAIFAGIILIASLLYVVGNVQAGGKVCLSKKKLTLQVGAKKKLKLKGTKKRVKWSSNKKKVATVSRKGVVKAKKKGKAVITARVGRKKYRCKVTVVNKKTSTASVTQSPIPTQVPDTKNTTAPSSGVSSQPNRTVSPTPNGGALDTGTSVVYMTTDITPEGLMSVYEALNWTPTGKVAVKVSTGEPPSSNYLKPELIKNLVQSVHGTIVECNTAYGGSRAETKLHYQVAKDHGFTDIADVKIMDEDGSMSLPVEGGKHLSENYVGKAFADYDSYLVISHFKGHAMAGFGGAIKNISIGIASGEGKSWIHTGGTSKTGFSGNQDDFLESMGEAGKAVSDYLGKGECITYINVMNRLSVDCDCDGNPSEPDMHDIGILASHDPVALDQACVDLVYSASDGGSLVKRIESRNGLHTLEYAQEIGLGSRSYEIKSVDNMEDIKNMKMNVQIGDTSFTATLEDNAATRELVEMMKEAPVSIDMNDYSGFEKVGPLGRSLTTDNQQTTTAPGDIVLYSGNQIVMFYGSNSWSYTRIGKIDDLSGWEEALGSGNITAVFSLSTK